MGTPFWITGPESGPLFLPNALTGTKAFAVDGGMVTNANGVAGTVLGTTALTVDFTKQVAGINIDLSINDTTPRLRCTHGMPKHRQAAKRSCAAVRASAGLRSTPSSYNGTGPDRLTVTVDGSTSGNGDVSGQLTGTG